MSLKTKFTLLLSAIFIGLLLVNFSTLSLVVFPAFEELEKKEAEKNMARVLNILESDIKDADGFVYDWAAWDETYNFIKDKNQAYVDSNMYPEYSANQNHDLYYFWDSKGKPVLNLALNAGGTAYESFTGFPQKGLPANHPFLAMNTLTSKSSGIIGTNRGPMIIAARPITTTDLKGPIGGILAMGRHLDEPVIENLNRRSHLKLNIWSLADERKKDIPKDAPLDIKPGELKINYGENGENIFLYSTYPDIYGKPAILLKVSMRRDIVAQGKATIKYGIGMALVSGLVLILVLLAILQRSIISPLSSLAKNIVRLGKRENVAQQLPLNRGDEMGVVARSVFTSNEERNKAENILVYQNQVLDSIAKKTDLKLTLDKMMRLIESILPDSKASILLLDSEGTKLNPLSGPSLPKAYTEAITRVKIGPEVGACGSAAYHNKMVISEDIAHDPLWANMKNRALENNLKACWSFPINNSTGEVLGTFALYFSEVRRPTENEIKLIQPFSRLAGIAIENQIVDQQLIDSKNIAEKASNAKSEFLSMMSHELRTPMNAILGFGQVLALNSESNLSSTQEDNIKRILIAGDHLLKLIDEILDLSKIESGNFSLKEESIDISSVIEEVVLIINPLAQKRDIQIALSASESEARHFYGDPTALKQVLLNLLSNAVKYNKKKGSIDLVTEFTSDDSLRIAISDTGQGISKENMNLLFQPFQRLGAERTHIDGTGMGLSITKHLVELMGGVIEVTSIHNEGTCFTIELPLDKAIYPAKNNNSNTFLSSERTPANESRADDKNLELGNLNLPGIKISRTVLSQLKEAAKLNNITKLRFYLKELEKDEQALTKYMESLIKRYDMNEVIHILNQVGHE